MIPAPSCFGKLPSHGDFLRIRVPQTQKYKLDQWFSTRTKNNDAASAQKSPLSHQAHSISPWCFAIQGQLLNSSRHLMAVGVIFDSKDKIGRNYPFIIYQLVPKRWLLNQLKEPNHWLKVLRDFSLLCVQKDSRQLDEMLKKLWAEYKPEWRDFFRVQTHRRIASKQRQVQQLLSVWQPPKADDLDISNLQGVSNAPWLDWPQTVVSEKLGSFWWKLDNEGRYLNCIQHPQLDKELLEKLMA
ncbi:type VI secretion system-associated protein TagF [Hydromonas duriensis]|uniref:Type VI secretion system ImpM family protein n=1 Tax=Hydromonas duriensis TaxID=1527608 RepID=A0A4V3DJZ8_9BURK|nr:type VI secretion system-associated protein TagF [Hydromonas duriensis]TDR32129.1 type VI secretion system ImpM family protein [Hydromonas duriensis]